MEEEVVLVQEHDSIHYPLPPETPCERVEDRVVREALRRHIRATAHEVPPTLQLGELTPTTLGECVAGDLVFLRMGTIPTSFPVEVGTKRGAPLDCIWASRLTPMGDRVEVDSRGRVESFRWRGDREGTVRIRIESVPVVGPGFAQVGDELTLRTIYGNVTGWQLNIPDVEESLIGERTPIVEDPVQVLTEVIVDAPREPGVPFWRRLQGKPKGE